MAFRAVFDGVIIECDTVGESIELADAVLRRPEGPFPCAGCADLKAQLDELGQQLSATTTPQGFEKAGEIIEKLNLELNVAKKTIAALKAGQDSKLSADQPPQADDPPAAEPMSTVIHPAPTKPPREAATGTRRGRRGKFTILRIKIEQYLAENAPQRASDICHLFDVSEGSITALMNSPQFARLPDRRWTLRSRLRELEVVPHQDTAKPDAPVETPDDDEPERPSNRGGFRGVVTPEMTHEGPPPFKGDLVAKIKQYLEKNGPTRYANIAAALGARLDEMFEALKWSNQFAFNAADSTWDIADQAQVA